MLRVDFQNKYFEKQVWEWIFKKKMQIANLHVGGCHGKAVVDPSKRKISPKLKNFSHRQK